MACMNFTVVDQTINQTAPILSTLPREIRDQIWCLCIVSESEELPDGKRKMSFCLSDCKQARSCFPYEFFGPVCSSLGLGPAEYYALRRMNLIFTCKQIMTETAWLYHRVMGMKFTFRSTQCLEAFSVILGQARTQACITRLEVVEEIRPCLRGRGNDAKLVAWRAGIKERVDNIGKAYYQGLNEKTRWISTQGQVAEDFFTDIYWFQMSLEKIA